MRHSHHQQQPPRRLRTLLMLRHGTRAVTLLLLIGPLLWLPNGAEAQLIKLPRLSGRLRLPFFRKDPTKPLQNGQNMETDLTNFLQNGAQPGMPTLHKLLLKQYATPPMAGGGSAPQASHMYPSSMAPFGMPRLPAPTSVRPMGHPPPPQLPMYPMPHHMTGFHPMRPPYYPRPGGMMPGMPLPSSPYAVLPPPPGPRPPPPPPPPKVNKRPGPGPNVLFADKDPQGSDGNYESGEIEDETPIIIRGRKHHGKRRRPIVIEEDVSSEEDDSSRPIMVRGRKPYRFRGRRPPLGDDNDETDEPAYPSRKRPVTYIEDMSDSRPYGMRGGGGGGGGGGGFEDEVPKPSGSFMHDINTGSRNILRYSTNAGRFFHPADSSRFDTLMTSEQRNNPRATSSPGFYTGSPGGVIHDFSSMMSHQRHHDFSGLFDEPKMVLSPHIDAVTPLRDRHEASSFFPNKLESPPQHSPSKEFQPIVFHLPNKAPHNREKYVQALIVPIQANIDQVAEETLDKATSNRVLISPRGQSYVLLPPRTEGLQDKQQKETGPLTDSFEQEGPGRHGGPVAAQSFTPITYMRPPSGLDSPDNRIQPTYHPVDTSQSYAQPTAIRILVRNPMDGTSKEVFSSTINTGGPYQQVGGEPQYNPGTFNYGPGNDQNKSKLVIIALPRSQQSRGSPNSRSSPATNTYYQPTALNKRLPATSAETSTPVPIVYNDQRPTSQYLAPKVPYEVVASQSSASFGSPNSKPNVGNLGKAGYSSTSPFYESDRSRQQSRYKPKQSASSSNHARRTPSTYTYYRQQITPAPSSSSLPGAAAQRRATHVSQYARRKYSSTSDGLLGELPYDSSYPTSLVGNSAQEYPALTKIPETSFSCHNKVPGYYASTEHRCQVYHHCTAAGSLQTFLCPNGTAFSQQSLVCEWWHDVSCPPPRAKTPQPVKDSSLQSLTDDVGYPVYRWPTRTQQPQQRPISPPASAAHQPPTTTRAPQPPSYSSSVSFSIAAGTKAHTRPPFTGSGGGESTEYALGLGRGKLQNTTVTFQAGGQKVVRARKLVTKIRGSTVAGGQTRQRSKESSTTQSPDAKSSAE
ncbi:SH3 and multiple ankyrin repeat domains protein 3 [Rhipicephalus sanguineus]|nr:SH3 and multiple ankyrin repeat domains protein 3 [Rhipicephalus sanguineus]